MKEGRPKGRKCYFGILKEGRRNGYWKGQLCPGLGATSTFPSRKMQVQAKDTRGVGTMSQDQPRYSRTQETKSIYMKNGDTFYKGTQCCSGHGDAERITLGT